MPPHTPAHSNTLFGSSLYRHVSPRAKMGRSQSSTFILFTAEAFNEANGNICGSPSEATSPSSSGLTSCRQPVDLPVSYLIPAPPQILLVPESCLSPSWNPNPPPLGRAPADETRCFGEGAGGLYAFAAKRAFEAARFLLEDTAHADGLPRRCGRVCVRSSSAFACLLCWVEKRLVFMHS